MRACMYVTCLGAPAADEVMREGHDAEERRGHQAAVRLHALERPSRGGITREERSGCEWAGNPESAVDCSQA